MNQPYLEEGRLPENSDEVAVTPDYLDATGKRVGDTLTFGVNADDTTWAVGDTAQPQADADDDEDLSPIALKVDVLQDVKGTVVLVDVA